MTRPDLLEVVYRFYPRGVPVEHPEYQDTEESHRYREARRVALAEYPRWKELLGRLRPRFALADRSLHLFASTPADGGYSGEVRVAGGALGFHVSFLGPHYAIHRRGAPGEEPAASAIAREIEATYRYEPIPADVGHGLVPQVALDGVRLGMATIYQCLLSSHWAWSSYDDDAAAETAAPAPSARELVEGQVRPLTGRGLSREQRHELVRALLAMDEQERE